MKAKKGKQKTAGGGKYVKSQPPGHINPDPNGNRAERRAYEKLIKS